MNEKVVKRFYFVSGIFFGLAVLAGIIRLFDSILDFNKLEFLNVIAIVFLGLSLLVMISLVIHSYVIEKRIIEDAKRRENEPEKLKKYASKKNK